MRTIAHLDFGDEASRAHLPHYGGGFVVALFIKSPLAQLEQGGPAAEPAKPHIRLTRAAVGQERTSLRMEHPDKSRQFAATGTLPNRSGAGTFRRAGGRAGAAQ